MSRLSGTMVTIAGLLCSIWGFAGAQDLIYSEQGEVAQSFYEIPPRDLIDAPTAGTLARGSFDLEMRVYTDGGILGRTSIGLSNRFMIGMSYGAEKIIAEQPTSRNPRIEFNIKLRLIDESYYLPAFSLGFNSQGYGAYLSELQRYTYKSKGFYAVFSRSFNMKSMLAGGHIGINYSLENDVDKDREPSFFLGIDTRFNYNIGFMIEYDVALNDDRSSQNYAKGRGYLNLGVKWLYSENLELEIILRNLLLNRHDEEATTFGRELRFTYIEFF